MNRLNPSGIIDDLVSRYPCLLGCREEIWKTHLVLVQAISSGGKIMACGNGGSAADCEHLVGELMKSFKVDRPVDVGFMEAYRRANGEQAPAYLEGTIPAVSLVSQSALMTAFSNDESAVGVFAQQVYGYGRPGDVLIAISTSGKSANVVDAAKVARALSVKVIALTGAVESALTAVSDVAIRVPREEVRQVQELHLPVYHALCAALEAEVFGA